MASSTSKSKRSTRKEQASKSHLIPLPPDSFIPLDTKLEPLPEGSFIPFEGKIEPLPEGCGFIPFDGKIKPLPDGERGRIVPIGLSQ